MPYSIATRILILSAVAGVVCSHGVLRQVYFSFIVSNGENGYRSSGAVPAIDIALETVQQLQILPGYNLTYDVVKNSKVASTRIAVSSIRCSNIV